jgi:hypothetical protein
MKSSDFVKLRWLRLIALNKLNIEEYDLVMSLSDKVCSELTNEESEELNNLYNRHKKISTESLCV